MGGFLCPIPIILQNPTKFRVLEKYSVPKVSKKWGKVGERGVFTKHALLLIILTQPLPIMGNVGL